MNISKKISMECSFSLYPCFPSRKNHQSPSPQFELHLAQTTLINLALKLNGLHPSALHPIQDSSPARPPDHLSLWQSPHKDHSVGDVPMKNSKRSIHGVRVPAAFNSGISTGGRTNSIIDLALPPERPPPSRPPSHGSRDASHGPQSVHRARCNKSRPLNI